MAGATEVLLGFPGTGRGVTRLALVIPWHESGRWLWECLPSGYEGDLIFAAPRPGGRRLVPYVGELVYLVLQRPRWRAYDTVFTWELRTTLAVALLLKLLGRNRPIFVSVGPILKGPLRHPVALAIVRWLLRDTADRIVCFSRAECESYAALLRLPRGRFVFLPTPWRADESISDHDDGYILAIGNSNRDFPTLIEAVRGTDLPVLIVTTSRASLGETPLPENVHVQGHVGPEESSALIAAATLHCIPLYDTDFSAGQSVLLRAMARGKAVVASDTTGIRDYVSPDESAILVPPGDTSALRQALRRLWSDVGLRRSLGENAARAVRESSGWDRFVRALIYTAHQATPVSSANPAKTEEPPPRNPARHG